MLLKNMSLLERAEQYIVIMECEMLDFIDPCGKF